MKISKKLSKESKKFYERELRQYWDNKNKLNSFFIKEEKALKDDLISSRTIIYLKNRIDYIENVINRLTPFEKELFVMIFKRNYNWLYCKTQKNIDKNTYYNTQNKIIYMLAEEFGEV